MFKVYLSSEPELQSDSNPYVYPSVLMLNLEMNWPFEGDWTCPRIQSEIVILNFNFTLYKVDVHPICNLKSNGSAPDCRSWSHSDIQNWIWMWPWTWNWNLRNNNGRNLQWDLQWEYQQPISSKVLWIDVPDNEHGGIKVVYSAATVILIISLNRYALYPCCHTTLNSSIGAEQHEVLWRWCDVVEFSATRFLPLKKGWHYKWRRVNDADYAYNFHLRSWITLCKFYLVFKKMRHQQKLTCCSHKVALPIIRKVIISYG